MQARELALGSDVILIDAPAKLSHFEWKLEPTLVLKISFKPRGWFRVCDPNRPLKAFFSITNHLKR